MQIPSRKDRLPEVAVVTPVLNERQSIAEFCRRVRAASPDAELICVDNASTDGTAEFLAASPAIRLIRHERNLGYGASIRDGLAATTARKVVIIDADLEYPPEAIPDFVSALDRTPVVYGSRFLPSKPPEMPLLRRTGNRALSALFNLLFRQRTTDLYTGMKALHRDAVDVLDLKQDGFEHVVEMGAQLARSGFRIREIPVTYAPRTRGVSKMRHIPETLKYLRFVVRYRLVTDHRRNRCVREGQ